MAKRKDIPLQTVDKNDADEDFSSDSPPVKDRCHLVYIIFLLHGIGILMPWNAFITAYDYFINYKLKDTSTNTALNGSVLGVSSQAAPQSEYQQFFMNYLGIVAQLPNVALNLVNLFVTVGGGIKPRIVWSMVVMLLSFVFTIVMAAVDSSAWVVAFFWVTMLSVMILQGATGIYQNSLYGLVAILPMQFTNAVVLGNNVSGTITVVVSMVSKAVCDSMRTSAIFYFVFALSVLFVAFVSFFMLRHLRFFKAYEEEAAVALAKAGDDGPTPYRQIMKQVWVQCFSVWFVFFISLTNFPAVQLKVAPMPCSPFGAFFTDITCFLCFNLMATAGNFFTEIVRWPGPKRVWIPVLLRSLFLPFFLFCRYDLENRTFFPAVIHSDWLYFVGSILHGFTSGYFSSLAMMYAPSIVAPKFAGTAAMMAAFFLVLGIFSGICFSLVVGKVMVAVDTGTVTFGLTNGTMLNGTMC